jgi:hypothetical protein
LVFAQYKFNPMNADEQPGIRYFGSAKDEHGLLVPDVVITLETPKMEYVVFTDPQGRFHMVLDLSATADVVSASCAKPGFQLVRVTKRNGIGPRPSVQVDCVLRQVAAG